MKTIIGQAATGEFFYKREKLTDKLWENIIKGNNILISAPRRIGKTSLMLDLIENSKKGYKVIYVITESVNNKNEFFRKLVHEIYTQLSTGKKFSNTLGQIKKSTSIKSIGPKGIELEHKDIEYFNEFQDIVKQLELEGEKLIIMVDEFAQTVENIMQDEDDKKAINFLEANREIRIKPEINNKVQFVYAGSIGLENIVSHLNSTSTINDLYTFIVKPFTESEVKDYILNYAIEGTSLIFKEEKIEYLINKIEWLIPYFINILLEEIEEVCTELDKTEIIEKIIDDAFVNALKKRSYFEHWHIRLRKAYKQSNYNFSKELLNRISENNILLSNEIHDLAVKLGIENSYKDILNSLVYDGYINNNDDSKVYRFNSPLLRMWWNKNIAN